MIEKDKKVKCAKCGDIHDWRYRTKQCAYSDNGQWHMVDNCCPLCKYNGYYLMEETQLKLNHL